MGTVITEPQLEVEVRNECRVGGVKKTFVFLNAFSTVLRIRNVDTGSRNRIFLSRIQGQKYPGSASKNLGFFDPKKLFLSSRKNYLGCSSRILIPDPDFFPFRIHGSKKQRIPDLHTQHCFSIFTIHSSDRSKMYVLILLKICYR